jgi:signal transduction histidine kinase
MSREKEFRHLGGGRKGLFLLLRYLFIVAASYLLIFQAHGPTMGTTPALMIAMALASNLVLSFLPAHYVFSWYVEAPVLIADTIWVSWALHSTGTTGQEFFLLYFFVLFLAALGESLSMVLLGSTAVSAANVYFNSDTGPWTSAQLLRIAFFYTVALFYGHVLGQIRSERQRADRGFAWARELESKVGERTEELRRLYHESLAVSRLKSELVANMSHELRTPLNIIIGYSEMLLDRAGPPSEPEREKMTGRIRESARTLLQLVDSVLDLGKLESGRMPVTKESLSLDRLVAALRARERLTPAPGVGLVWRVPPGLPVIETDAAKLTVVLDNLINNAIKFTSSGSITVTVRDVPSRQRVEISVADTGPGIDERNLATIFEPFHQLESTGARAYGGVGLGLAIVQRYVLLLGGEVAVRSTLGTGTTFVVTLPYRPHDVGRTGGREPARDVA